MKDAVFFLVEKGIDIEIKNKINKTAGEEAYDKDFFDISEYLVGKEVAILKNVEITDDFNNEEFKDFESDENDEDVDMKITEKDL